MKSCKIITGEKGSGKTTYALSLFSHNPTYIGYVTLHKADEYFLLNLSTKEEKLLLSPRHVFSSKWKNWYVNEALFDEVYTSLLDSKGKSIILDECGRMEMDGRGFSRTIKMLLSKKDVNLTLVVRDSFVNDLTRYFSIVDYSLITVPKWT